MTASWPSTLDHIRIYLALRDVTLKNDKTPTYWKERLSRPSRIGNIMAESELNVTAPFTVVIDSMEQQPFGFDTITPKVTETPSDLRKMVTEGDIKQSDIKFIVPREFRALGVANGDYSIDGFEGRCNIERKSMNDAHGTILSYGDRQRRFERELENLATMECAAVVVECSFGELLAEAPSHGKKTTSENRKILQSRVIAWMQDYRVPWHFCESRKHAEVTAFRIMQRFFRKVKESNRATQKQKRLSPELAAAIDEL